MRAKARRKAPRAGKARHAARKRARTAYPRKVALQTPHLGYESALLKCIVSGRTGRRVSEYALAFIALIANSTPSIRAISYRHGIAIGRSLYRIYAQERRYSLYEESVADLVSFFERAGFGRITYGAFPGAVRISMHDNPRMELGIGMHTFEAGLIAGFLTAARRQLVHVTESACSSNGSDACEFRTFPVAEGISQQAPARRAFSAFISSASKRAPGSDARPSGVSEEYYALSSLVLLDSRYFREVRILADHLGGMLASELGVGPRRALRAASGAISLLGMGASSARVSGNDSIGLQFSMLHSRKEFADLAVAFLNGFLRGASSGSGIAVKCLARKNVYRISIARKAKSRK